MIASQEADPLSDAACHELDASSAKKRLHEEEEEELIELEEAEVKRNTLSQIWEGDSPSPSPSQESIRKRPAIHKKLARRFLTKSKRMTEIKANGEDSGESSAEESESASQGFTNRSRGINLTVEQEKDVVQWFQKHEIFYNKKLMVYKDTGEKGRLLEEKAAELNVHVNQLKTWYDGMRTRFARISSTRSAQGPVLDQLTERDRWIYNSFQFLLPHIVRVPSRQSKTSIREDQASRPSMPSTSDMQVRGNNKANQDMIATPPVNPSAPTSTPSSRKSRSSAAVPDELPKQLLEKLYDQHEQMMVLQNRLVSTLQPHSAHAKQISHFMAFLGSLCETMTPGAWKSFMVKVHQLALDHTPPPTEPPPPQAPTHMQPHHYYQPRPYNPPTQQSQQQQQQIQQLQQQLAALQAQASSSIGIFKPMNQH